ncbi:MAG: hypothetical protein IJ794_17100 [Lachnospiraceae bacterium]|nr:hypothetical protein [Lachnospiraceae bacterium]
MNPTGIWSLIRILYKNTQMMLPRRPLYRVLAALAVFGILFPCGVVVGFCCFVMTEALILAGNPGGGMLFAMQILSVFSMVFGTWVIFGVMFFSSDREHFVTLPIPAHHLMVAKFIYAYVAESLMECFMLAAVFIGYFIAVAEDGGWKTALQPVPVIAAVFGTILIPFVPMVYCTLYSLLLTACLKRVRSAKVFHHASTILLIVFAALFIFSLRGIGEINVETYVELLGSGGDLFLRTLNILFFPVPWLAEAVGRGSIWYLCAYLGANIGLAAVLYGCGRLLYQAGLYTVAALGSTKRARISYDGIVKRSPFLASLSKEIKVLVRTKAFANNCVYVNLIWPLGAFLLLRFTKDQGAMADFIRLYRAGKDRADFLLTFVAIAVGLIAGAMNSIASTAFTREGQHLSLLKYIPVSYEIQLRAKAAVSMLFTYPVLLLTDGIVCFYMGAPMRMGLFYAALLLAAQVISTAIGMGLDSAAPYVTWDDEYSALRGNINSFFNMAVMMIAVAVIAGIGYLLFEWLKLPTGIYHLVLLVALAGTAVGVALIESDNVVANMSKM